jgi:hypothetical protein
MQILWSDVHIKNPIKNSYQDGLGRTTQALDHVVVVHILIWDKKSLKLTNIVIKPPLGGRSITKPRDHGTPNAHNHWFILFYDVWGSAWVEIHWNSIWLRARSHMASHNPRGSVTILHDFGGVLGRPLDILFWGSHNFMVIAHGLCVSTTNKLLWTLLGTLPHTRN